MSQKMKVFIHIVKSGHVDLTEYTVHDFSTYKDVI